MSDETNHLSVGAEVVTRERTTALDYPHCTPISIPRPILQNMFRMYWRLSETDLSAEDRAEYHLIAMWLFEMLASRGVWR